MRKQLSVIFGVGVLLIAFLGNARTIYVSPAGTNNAAGNFPDWAGAATNMFDAVSKATSSGDLILVTNSLYVLTNRVGLTVAGVTMRSWNNGSLDPTNTILKGSGSAACLYMNALGLVVAGFRITNGFTTANDASGGVLIGSGMGSGGGTLSNCFIVGNTAGHRGAGIYLYSTNGMVTDCLVAGNLSTNTTAAQGGGICLRGGTVKNCRIYNNTCMSATTGGGGGGVAVLLVDANPVNLVMGNTIVSNQAALKGGGIHASCNGYVLTLISNRCEQNVANSEGGGMYLSYAGANSRVEFCDVISNRSASMGGMGVWNMYGGVISNCAMIGNVATNGSGGGFYTSISGAYTNHFTIANCAIIGNSTLTGAGWGGGGAVYEQGILQSCVIRSNYAGTNGGGVYFRNSDYLRPAIYNSLVADNTAGLGSGGGVYVYGTSLVENCTIAGNLTASGSGSGGGVYLYAGSNIIVRNTICYTNQAASAPNWIVNATVKGYEFSYGCTTPTNGLSGSNNVAGAPVFADVTNRNYRLTSGSPCVDAGLNQPWMQGAPDLDGRLRLDRWRGIVDMGCYEYFRPGCAVSIR